MESSCTKGVRGVEGVAAEVRGRGGGGTLTNSSWARRVSDFAAALPGPSRGQKTGWTAPLRSRYLPVHGERVGGGCQLTKR